MRNWKELANREQIERAIDSLKKNGIEAEYVEDRDKVMERIHELVPQRAEVMTMSSVTLDSIGISKEINESGKYESVKKRLSSMNRETQHREMQRLGAAPEYALGSVHAVTEDGKIIVASNTGSQLPAYVYGSDHVIWIVGTQKIVRDLDEGMKRIYEYVLPLESERLKKVYGVPSNVSKLLIVNKEINKGRMRLIFIDEPLGF